MFYFLIFSLFSIVLSENTLNETNDEYNDYYNQYEGSDTVIEDSLINLAPIQTLLNQLTTNQTKWPQEVKSAEQMVHNLERMQTLMTQIMEALTKTAMPLVMENIFQIDLSDTCMSTIVKMMNAFQQQKEWAIKFFDSSARLPFSGLMDGTVADFGEYDECLSIDHKDDNMEVKGKYCMTSLALPMPPMPENLNFHESIMDLSNSSLRNTFWSFVAKNANFFYILQGIRLGVCVPNTCSAHELQSIADKILEPMIGLNIKIGPNCETREDRLELTVYQMTAIAILSMLCLFVFVSTIFDTFGVKSHSIVNCFSLLKNTRKLFQTNTQTKRLSVIHGLRVVSIIWILVGHVYLMQFFQVFHVMRRTLTDMPRLAWYRYQPLKLGSFLQVETFLLLGGVTASYVTLEVMTKVREFDYFAFLFFRWLRYTPALIGLILMYFLLPLIASGPIYGENIDLMVRPCEQFWWRNLLYVNNFYDTTGNCATHTWYLAVDFQLYAFSPIIIFALKRFQTFGLLLNISIIIFGSLVAIIPPLIDTHTLPAMYSMSMMLSDQTISHTFRVLYWATYQHLAPYYMGVLVGFLVHRYRSFPIPRPLELLIWVLCLTSGIGTVFWTTDWMNSIADRETPDRWQRLLFTACHKTTWSVMPAWIVICNAFGRPGPLGRLLSHKAWVPLSRLTYGLYLVQLIPIVLRSYSVKHVMPFDDFYNWSTACLCLVLALILSYILWILFESPFSQMIKIITNEKNVQKFIKNDKKQINLE